MVLICHYTGVAHMSEYFNFVGGVVTWHSCDGCGEGTRVLFAGEAASFAFIDAHVERFADAFD